MGASSGQLRTGEFICLLALATSLSALAIDAFLPAMSEISHNLSLPADGSIQLMISLFILGMAFGEVTFGPLADRFGRKQTMMAGLAIFWFGSVGTLLSETYPELLTARVIQGFGAAGVKITSRAMVRDVYQGEGMARIMSMVFAIFMIVPLVAPAIGQLILSYFGWKGIPVLFLLYSLTFAVWLYLRQPETLAEDRRVALSVKMVGKSAGRVLCHPQVMAYTSIAGLTFGIQLTYLGTIEPILNDNYAISSGFALYFAANAIGLCAAFLLNSLLVSRYGMKSMVTSGLLLLVVAGLMMELGGRLDSSGTPPLVWLIGACFVMLFAAGLVFGNINSMAMQYLGGIAGLGASMIAAISSLIAFLVAATLGVLDNDGISALTTGLIACGVLSTLLLYGIRRVRAPHYL